MSHFTKIKTLIREQERLCEALRELHHQFRQGENLVVRGDRGNTQTAQVVVNTGCSYDIGYQRQGDGTYEAVADWDYGIPREAAPQFQKDNFLSEINQRYQRLTVREMAKVRGYTIESERVLPSGEIELVVCEPI